MRRLPYFLIGVLGFALLFLLSANPAHAQTANDYLAAGQALYAKGDYAGAISNYDKAIAIDPKNEPVYVNRGNANYQLGALDDAIADYNKAIALQPTDALPYYNLCDTYYQKNDLDTALTDCNKAVELDPTYAPAYDSRGLIHRVKGDLDGALGDYTQAIKLDPQNANALTNRGRVYQDKGNFPAAIADFDAAILIAPDNADAYFYRGAARDSNGDHEGAISDFNEVLSLQPDYPQADQIKAYMNRSDPTPWIPPLLGSVLIALTYTFVSRQRVLRAGRQPRFSFFMSTMQVAIVCIFIWTTLFSLDLANQWRFQINLTPLLIIAALCLIGIGGIASILFPMYWVKQALSNADYDKALRRARLMRFIPVPGNIPLFLQGTILTIAGRNQEAETALHRLKATRTGDRAIEMNGILGAALYQMGQYDEAIQLLEELITARPGGTDTYNTLAEVYLAKGDGAQALELADKAMQNKRTRLKSDYFVWGEILANRAWALAQLGRCEEAKTQLEQALRESEHGYKPSLAGQQYRAAQVMRLCGDVAKSTELLNRAIEIDPNGAYGQLAKAALQTNEKTYGN